MSSTPVVTAPSWEALRRFTDARIALGRAGHSMPTDAHLALQLAQAQARDAVHLPLDVLGVSGALLEQGLNTMALHSAALDRATYLRRPDQGRRLDAASHDKLQACKAQARKAQPFDLALVVADGLSALAIHTSAVALISSVVQRLRQDRQQDWSLAPVTVVEQGRVAVGDEIAQCLKANAVVVLIGERPGLSSPDSLGIYFTWAAKIGCTDAQRNCISNVRPAGLGIAAATEKLLQLLQQSRLRRLSGVQLKDEVDDAGPLVSTLDSTNGARRLSFGP